ncbi:MAG: hypothetical protein R3F43_02840 [bacterium]
MLKGRRHPRSGQLPVQFDPATGEAPSPGGGAGAGRHGPAADAGGRSRPPFADLVSPFAGDPAAVTAGETLYQQCVACHGAQGEEQHGLHAPASAFNVDQSGGGPTATCSGASAPAPSAAPGRSWARTRGHLR